MAGRPPTQTPPQEGKQILTRNIRQKNKKIHNNRPQTKSSTQYRNCENRLRKQRCNTLLLPPGRRRVHLVQTPKWIPSQLCGNSNSVTHHQNKGHHSHNASSIHNPEREHSIQNPEKRYQKNGNRRNNQSQNPQLQTIHRPHRNNREINRLHNPTRCHHQGG